MNDPEGGELVCYLSQLSHDGTILDPRSAVRTEDGSGRLPRIRIDVGSLAVLQPLERETEDDYRGRLQSVLERTAAWSIALAALDHPVVLAGSAPPGHIEVLAEYVRALMSEE